jgi:hypothetical protein
MSTARTCSIATALDALIPWLDGLVLLGLSAEPGLETVPGAGGLAADGPEPLVPPLFVDDVPDVPVPPPPIVPVPPLPLIPLAPVPPMPPTPAPPDPPRRHHSGHKPLGQMRSSLS